MPRYFGLIPAAGSGSRVGAKAPKQYLTIAGSALVQHAMRILGAHPSIAQVWVVLAPGDRHFRTLDTALPAGKVEPLYCGGASRAASVFNGLLAARDAAAADDWVLVHDAARPCLSMAALDRLIAEVGEDATGGLLAVPVTDTLKRGDAQARVVATEARGGLWQAQTPQMFRYGLLVEALRRCGGEDVTDEAGAIERLGLQPRLVRGEACNLKVTYADDLELAARILQAAHGGSPA